MSTRIASAICLEPPVRLGLRRLPCVLVDLAHEREEVTPPHVVDVPRQEPEPGSDAYEVLVSEVVEVPGLSPERATGVGSAAPSSVAFRFASSTSTPAE